MLCAFGLEVFWVFSFFAVLSASDFMLYEFKEKDILSVVENACLFVGSHPVSQDLRNVLEQLSNVYIEEDTVEIGTLDTVNLKWPTGSPLRWKQSNTFVNFVGPRIEVAFFRKREVDRTCLTKPRHVIYPMAELYDGPSTLAALVPFINSVCGTFRDVDGKVLQAGEERKAILHNLFRVNSISEHNMGSIYSTKANPLNQSFVWDRRNDLETCDTEAQFCRFSSESTHSIPITMATCEVVDHEMTKSEFLTKYLKRSKPVIFKNAVAHWSAFKKWTNEFFKTKHGEQRVHIKLTPKGDFEGVEKADVWEDFKFFKIPDAVLGQLLYPDLVVVRPAHDDMLMSKFIDLINKTENQSNKNVSAYLEYSSVKDIREDLEKDVFEPHFMKYLLKLKHVNIWLSDGDTLGRLHFDPFDNLLCQVRICLSDTIHK